MKKALPIILGVLLILGGIAHLVSPEAYDAMIPEFIPSFLANILAAIAEVVIGISLIVPKYRSLGGILFMALMIAFLPIHVWDLFKETPAIGPMPAPVIRLLVQFLLIYAGWWIYKKYKTPKAE